MTVTGLPRPLPECRRCRTPMPRRRHTVTGGYCTTCMTTAEAMTARHRAEHMRRLAADSTTPERRAQARIDALAAKRQARATRSP